MFSVNNQNAPLTPDVNDMCTKVPDSPDDTEILTNSEHV